MAEARRLQVVSPYPGAIPEVASWLWAMEETRCGLVDTVAELDQPALDWRGPEGSDNSIGSLLYHVALIEMSWLYDDILLQEPPEDIGSLFPENHRDSKGRLTHVPGVALEDHLRRLELSRSRFLETLAPISAADWTAVREPPDVDYACSPAWVVFHLVEHEAGHTFQVREIKRRLFDARGHAPSR